MSMRIVTKPVKYSRVEDIPNLGPLHESGVWAEHEQISFVIERLSVLLRRFSRPGVCCMRLDSLNDQIRRAVRLQGLRKLDGV